MLTDRINNSTEAGRICLILNLCCGIYPYSVNQSKETQSHCHNYITNHIIYIERYVTKTKQYQMSLCQGMDSYRVEMYRM